jgi:hypothetical protein
MGAHEDRMTRLQEVDLRNKLLLKRVNEASEELDKAEEHVRVLEKALTDAADAIEAAVSYVSPYFIEKYGFDAALNDARRALAPEGTPEESP